MTPVHYNILRLNRMRILDYVRAYDMHKFKEQPYGLDYWTLFGSEFEPVYEGDRIEQFCSDLILCGCNDLMNYIQVTTLSMKDPLDQSAPILNYIFARKDFVENVMNADFNILDETIDLIAKRAAVAEHRISFDEKDHFEGSETSILEDHELEYSDYYYDTTSLTIMNAVTKDLGVTVEDNHTWVALIDYVVSYISDKFSAAVAMRTAKYESRIQEIIREKATAAKLKDIDSSTAQYDIDMLLSIQKNLQVLSDSSKNLSRYFNNRSFAFTEEVIAFELNRLKSIVDE